MDDNKPTYTPRPGPSPCKDCQGHALHCHSTCEKYQAWMAWRDARSKELRLKGGADVVTAECVERAKLKYFRHRRK